MSDRGDAAVTSDSWVLGVDVGGLVPAGWFAAAVGAGDLLLQRRPHRSAGDPFTEATQGRTYSAR
jgi:hypothetical protein